jgi:hypothetical protein
MEEQAELLRVKYKYRSLIVRGQLRLPLEVTKRLVGPDCAYPLYASLGGEGVQSDERCDTGGDAGL